ncbi:hypothetical protein AB0O78_36930, partial [Streptomyces griseoviridis]|uniref:hypothetical protein n=1 Tax=Streptomyces griseoviridis TaxID=45398 RepID=UPI003425A5A6
TESEKRRRTSTGRGRTANASGDQPAKDPLRQLTRRLGWFKDAGKGQRPAPAADRGSGGEDPSGRPDRDGD